MTPRTAYLAQAFVWTCAIMTVAMFLAYYGAIETAILAWWYS